LGFSYSWERERERERERDAEKVNNGDKKCGLDLQIMKKNSVNSSNFRRGDSWIDSRQPLQPDYPMDSASMGERERERE